jgi:hypothetical protein
MSWKTEARYRSKPKAKLDRKERKCLRCLEVFQSTWKGNRICKKCAALNDQSEWLCEAPSSGRSVGAQRWWR